MWKSCFEHLLISFVSLTPNIIFTSIAPLLPLEIERRGLTSLYSGVIFWYTLHYFSCYSLGALCSPFISKTFVRKFGRLRSALLMLLLQSLCILSFGLSKLISNDVLFISLSMLSRFFEGLVCSLFFTFLLMMIPAYYENYSTFMAAYALGFQLSDLVGPVWGGVLYKYLGYIGVFASQSLTCFVSLFSLLYFRAYEQRNPYKEVKEVNSLSYSSLLKVPGVLFGFIGLVLAQGFYVSIDPILPFKLSRQFDMDQHGIGLFFLRLNGVVAFVGTLLLFVPHKTNKVYFMILGYFILTAGIFMSGPSRLFGFPNSLSLMKVGMSVGGVGKPLVHSFALSYIVKNGEVRYPWSAEEVYDKVAVMVQFAFGVSLIVIPLTMSLIFHVYNFESALDTYGAFVGLNAIAFLSHAAQNNWNRDEIKQAPLSPMDEESRLRKDEEII